MDIGSAIEHAVTAAITGGGTFYAVIKAAIAPTIRPLQERIKRLEQDVVLNNDIAQWKRDVVQGLRLEWESLRLEIERQSRPSTPSFDRYDDLRRRIDDLARDVQRLEQQRFVTQEDFQEFTREEGRQWTEINRSMGEIRGELRTLKRP